MELQKYLGGSAFPQMLGLSVKQSLEMTFMPCAGWHFSSSIPRLSCKLMCGMKEKVGAGEEEHGSQVRL